MSEGWEPSLNMTDGWESPSLRSPNPLGVKAHGTHTIGPYPSYIHSGHKYLPRPCYPTGTDL